MWQLGVRTQALQSFIIVVGHFIQSPIREGKEFYQTIKKFLSHALMVVTHRQQIGFEPTDQDSGKTPSYSQQDAKFFLDLFLQTLYMFRTVP